MTSLRLAPFTPSVRSMSVPSDLQRGRTWLLFVTLMIRWAAMAGSYCSIRSLAASHLDGKQRQDFSVGADIFSEAAPEQKSYVSRPRAGLNFTKAEAAAVGKGTTNVTVVGGQNEGCAEGEGTRKSEGCGLHLDVQLQFKHHTLWYVLSITH